MRLRAVDPTVIVDAGIMSHKAGLQLDDNELESHYLAGGNVPNVVRAIVALQRGSSDQYGPVAGSPLLREAIASYEQREFGGALLDPHRQVTLHDYPDDEHAFSRIEGAHYNPESAHLADSRTLEFFRKNLRTE